MRRKAKFILSEYGHVAYQVKGNGAYSNMVVDTPQHRGRGLKVETFFFLKVVKFKGMEHIAPCKHILCPYTHPRSLGSGQKV